MRTVLTLILVGAIATAQAQQAPAPASPKAASPVAPPPDQLEPAVDTRLTTGGQDTAPTEPASRPSVAPGPSAAAAPSAPAGKPVAVGQTAAAASRSGAARPKGTDRVELETTDITGNRELPKVLYIVPWKRSDLGDLVGKPANSLLDEVLQPIDRDVFLRENRYYDALKPDRAPAGAGTVPGSGDRH